MGVGVELLLDLTPHHPAYGGILRLEDQMLRAVLLSGAGSCA